MTRGLVAFHQGRKALSIPFLTPSPPPAFTNPPCSTAGPSGASRLPPVLSERHITALSSPPLGTFLKHRDPGERGGGAQREAQHSCQHRRCSWRAVVPAEAQQAVEGSSVLLQPRSQQPHPHLKPREEPQADGNNEMSASSTMLKKCHSLSLV